MKNTAEDICLLGENAVINWYDGLLRGGVLFADSRQRAAAEKLQAFAAAPAPTPENFWQKIFAPHAPKQNGKNGLYLCGGVGRGKSFLMDGFYLQLRVQKKMRAHFHQFMRRLHEDLKNRKGEKDPLRAVADSISAKFDIICFDEFHVSDIADAMILARLLTRLFQNGTRMIMTSNYAPAELYPGGLARDRFLPAIAMLERRLEIFPLDGGEDYRLRHLNAGGGVFFHPPENCETRLRRVFDTLACGIALPPQIKINGRQIPAVARASDAIWFSFAQLCGGALAHRDYLSLAERYAVVLLSGAPVLDDDSLSEAARRFTWLVDVLYDRRVTLVMGAAAPLEKLYGNMGGGESGRTLSRLIEMQSSEYWGGALPPEK
ncbi:MAG: cell division protein ZapE [Betaproteobacteria bacterium]|nr:cell division protein ZapE [Betaproteobacteria bacterium]